MDTINAKQKTKINQPKAPLVITVKTVLGNYVSMKQITPSEIKVLRNSSYLYLA